MKKESKEILVDIVIHSLTQRNVICHKQAVRDNQNLMEIVIHALSDRKVWHPAIKEITNTETFVYIRPIDSTTFACGFDIGDDSKSVCMDTV